MSDPLRAPMRPRIRSVALLGLVLIASAGCANRAVVDRRVDDYDGSVTQSTSFQREGEMERAGRLLGERDFAGAIEIYQRLYRSAPDLELRAESLLRWAQAEGNLLNPDRDADRAIARLELLLEEFPQAPVQREAKEELERMRRLRAGGAGAD